MGKTWIIIAFIIDGDVKNLRKELTAVSLQLSDIQKTLEKEVERRKALERKFEARADNSSFKEMPWYRSLWRVRLTQ